jgi:hypothetical protein
MSKHEKRSRQQPEKSEDERAMQALANWARGMKNEKANYPAGERDIMPVISIVRDSVQIALIWLVGDSEKVREAIRIAVRGYGATELQLVQDTYRLQAKSEEEFERYRYQDLSTLFNSPDPTKRALVSEAILIFRARYDGQDKALKEISASMTYEFDSRKNKFRWRPYQIDDERLLGPLRDYIIRSFDGFDLFNTADALGYVEGLSAIHPERDQRLEADIAVTKALLRLDHAVALLATVEQSRRLDEVLSVDYDVTKVDV